MHSKPYCRPCHPASTTLLLVSDNTATLALLKERRNTPATQTIGSRFTIVRISQLVLGKTMTFKFVSTNENWADSLTKALPQPALELGITETGMHRMQ